jgi:tricorn protease
VSTPLLGVDYALDQASGRYRFATIYAGDNSRPDLNAPLGAPGLNVHQGDYLLAVNGQELRVPASPASALTGLNGSLTLTIASSPEGPRREVIVQPVDDEQPLRLMDWVARNRATVSRLSGGRLGYIYLPDFDDQGSREFVRQFYPQVDKEGLIIDVRWNLGGFTSQAVLDVLRRQRAGVFVNREGAVASLPSAVAPRAMVTLMNYGSMSDGDQFPYFFRAFKLGPLVGSRTWGGVQGLNGPWRLMDGSFVTIPKDSLADTDGRWVIENEGVAPDIAIEDAPDEAQTGRDAQLERAVTAGLAQLKLHPMAPLAAPPPLPAYPVAGNVPGARFGTKPKD